MIGALRGTYLALHLQHDFDFYAHAPFFNLIQSLNASFIFQTLPLIPVISLA